MTRAYTWTAKRDAVLRDLSAARFSVAEIARALACDAELVRLRKRELGLIRAPRRGPATQEVATVPRPVARPRPGLIDISKAPSSMEQRAVDWARR